MGFVQILPPQTPKMFLTLSELSQCYSNQRSLRTELAVASVLYPPGCVYYRAEQ